MNRKHYFAPLPNRALGDVRLKGLHFRVLGAVAAHDRFGQNGKGCTLSTRRIADKLDATQQKVAEAIRELIAWGYVGAAENPNHVQGRMLHIAYDDEADRAFVASANRRPTGRQFNTKTDTPQGVGLAHRTGKNRRPTGLTEDTPLKEAKENIRATPARTGVRGAGSATNLNKEDATYLRELEVELKAGGPFAEEWLWTQAGRCREIAYQREFEDRVGQWALRLGEDACRLLDDARSRGG